MEESVLAIELLTPQESQLAVAMTSSSDYSPQIRLRLNRWRVFSFSFVAA
jgi:hypothetical protein